MKKFGNILWGLVFIVIGVIFACNALEITNINIFFDGWWTMFIIVPCFIGIFKEDEKTGNIIGLIVGVVLLTCCQGYLDFNTAWKLFVPGILIIIGLSFLFRDVIGGKVSSEIKKLNKNKTENNEYCAAFAGQDINFNGQEFNGADLTAVFGGVKCDLKQSIITSDQVINACSVFGGIELYLPENVQVKIKSTPIFGGVTNKNSYTVNNGEHTIYINATCIFGGVEIK
ncbi:MAG: cell wall-active antibiotics response protein [Clostridiaceae bacterium]|nr:cell wall-active antibiotics response protein [Clostridiaceae bacterium]